jgi:hypothetical protein
MLFSFVSDLCLEESQLLEGVTLVGDTGFQLRVNQT